MNLMKVIVSVGVAVATAKVAKALTNVGVDDVLGYAGLERRRSHVWEKLAYFGAGALAGAGAGLLLAPASGRETRAKIGEGVENLAAKATEALAELKEQGPELIGRVSGESAPVRTNAGNQGR